MCSDLQESETRKYSLGKKETSKYKMVEMNFAILAMPWTVTSQKVAWISSGIFYVPESYREPDSEELKG